MDISFVIVNYKSEEYLHACIKSVAKKACNISHEIIIVNNDEVPLSNAIFTKNTQVINRGINDGFGRACNLGANVATGGALFFLNPDTIITTGNLEGLLNTLNKPFIGIVAPQIFTPSEKVQPWSSGYAITLWNILQNNFGYIKSRRLWKTKQQVSAGWVSGAALLIKKSIFEDISGFDEKFFMYFEDVDLCKRVMKLNKQIVIHPAVKIVHFGGKSSSSTSEQKKQYYQSQDYYFKKHHGSLQSSLLRILRCTSLFLRKHA